MQNCKSETSTMLQSWRKRHSSSNLLHAHTCLILQWGCCLPHGIAQEVKLVPRVIRRFLFSSPSPPERVLKCPWARPRAPDCSSCCIKKDWARRWMDQKEVINVPSLIRAAKRLARPHWDLSCGAGNANPSTWQHFKYVVSIKSSVWGAASSACGQRRQRIIFGLNTMNSFSRFREVSRPVVSHLFPGWSEIDVHSYLYWKLLHQSPPADGSRLLLQPHRGDLHSWYVKICKMA